MSFAVMVNGLPGSMGHEVAGEVLRRGYTLVPWSLTGEPMADDTAVVDGVTVRLLKPSVRDAAIDEIRARYPGMISVDYTHPSAVNDNARFYIRHRLPFVMGTTGGDRAALMDDAVAAALPAVIAPNMAKQIVALQAMLEWAARSFPGVFSGYELAVTESHQATKADTSGTARAIVKSFNAMGIAFDESQIRMVRAPEEQRALGVPAEYLGGHAWHTYRLTAPDGRASFEFQHNVLGRTIYATGSVDAVAFLHREIARGAAPRVYSMIDVLQAGGMA